MHQYRENFSKLIKEHKFLPIAIVRGRGQVEGYLSSKVGIIKTADGRNQNACRVLFHATDIYLFGHPLSLQRDRISDVVPIGLRLCFDARASPREAMANEVAYQACAVFAGSWPAVPHPTTLPGGPGSNAPCYEDNEDSEDQTYYYLQLSLKMNLDKKWQDFCDRLTNDRPSSFQTHGSNVLSYIDVGISISNKHDYQTWREFYAPENVRRRDRRIAEGSQHGHRDPRRKKLNFHYFKRATENNFKVLHNSYFVVWVYASIKVFKIYIFIHGH